MNLSSVVEVKLSKQVYEKNFVAFEHENQTFFAYSIEPHEIYHLDMESGDAAHIATTSNKLLQEAISHTDIWLHGGSSAIKVKRNGEEEFLSVCHVKQPDTEIYTTFAYTFSSNPPFHILSWSSKLPLVGRIQMAMSLVLLDDKLIVSYGRDDKEMRVAAFPMNEFLMSLQDISEFLSPFPPSVP